MRFQLALAFALAGLVACDDIPIDVDCKKATGVMTGKVTAGPVTDVVTSDLTVKGVSDQSDGLTVRKVVVAGIPAHNDGFNFEQWTAVVPITVLAGLPDAPAGKDKVEVAVAATDVCDRTTTLDSFVVSVDRTPAVRIDRLALVASFPGEKTDADRFLPADGSASALIRITANPDAHGASVTLATSFGSFQGTGDGGRVTLAGDGSADATATVLFTADHAGHAVLTASAKGVSAPPLTIDVAGPPTLLPSSAQLKPSGTVPITVFSDAVVKYCQATPATNMTARSGGTDLMGSQGAEDTNGDGRPDILVTALPALSVVTKTTVKCVDRYGQFSTGEYDGSP